VRDIVLTALDYLRWYTLQLFCRVLVWLARAAQCRARRDDEDLGPPLQRWTGPD